MNVSDPGRFADLAATNMNFKISDKDEIVQRLDIGQRLRFLLGALEREVGTRARRRRREAADRDQDRAAPARVLSAPAAARDPGRARRSRSGRKGSNRDAQEDRRGETPRESGARKRRRETERMRMLSPASSEYQVIRTYLDWLLSLPWDKRSGERRSHRAEEGRGSARQPALRAERSEGADHRVPRGAEAPRRRSAWSDSLLRRSAGHRKDIARRSNRDGDRPRVLPDFRRWSARRSGDPRTSPHVRRRDAGL